ncbi:MAG: tripartite tricarboxylate transporter substrate binding protein [Rhodospirillales bacterium]|nr:tripartite tricarboxylate transporter substrate binding protein [Rhodospirillales bacterium]
MIRSHRWTIACVAIGALAAVAPSPSFAAVDLPCRAVRMIVPWNAGGDTDLIFRPVVDALNALNPKAQLQVVNIGGQSGNKGAREVRDAKPDGCTLLAMHDSQITTYLAGGVDFTWDAFQPVALLTYTPSMLAAGTKTPYNDMAGLIDYAKKNPGQIKAGVTTGSTSQFLQLMIEDAAKISFKYVPYEGTRERNTALLANNIDVGESNILTAKEYVKNNQMKALAIATEKRDPLMPDLKTMREYGLDVVYGLSRGVVMPKGASAELVTYYEDLFRRAMQAPKVKEVMDTHSTWIQFKGAKDYAAFLKSEYEKSEKLAIKIGLYKKK